MTTQEKKILKLAKQLCKENGASWQHLYDAEKGQYIVAAFQLLKYTL